MQKILISIVFLAASWTAAFSQMQDWALPSGFSAEAISATPLQDGHWVVMGYGRAGTGIIKVDTVFIVLLDANGNALKRKNLSIDNQQAYFPRQVLGTPDGGFVTVVGTFQCTSGAGVSTSIQKYNADAELQWEINTQPTAGIQLPSKLAVTPDGNLIGLANVQIYKINAATGAVIWQTYLGAPLITYERDFVLLPGTEKLVTFGQSTFQLWEQDVIGGYFGYYLISQDDPDPSGLSGVLKNSGDPLSNDVYCLDNSHQRLWHTNPVDWTKDQIYIPDFIIVDYDVLSDGILLLGVKNGFQLVKVNFAGQLIQSFPISDSHLHGFALTGQQGHTLVAGTSVAGFESTDLWIRTIPDLNLPEPVSHADAAVTDVMLNQPIQTDTSISGTDYVYAIHGGAFQIQVTNKGTDTLQSVAVRFRFQDDAGGPCTYKPSKSVEYHNLNLATGASTWLDFGDVSGVDQIHIPTQYCFWTAAPNNRPDANTDNDTYCKSVIPTGVDNLATGAGWRIYPNPASDGFWVEGGETKIPVGDYQLFNSIGQLTLNGIIPVGTIRFFISTAALPKGFYWLRAGNGMEKIIIEH